MLARRGTLFMMGPSVRWLTLLAPALGACSLLTSLDGTTGGPTDVAPGAHGGVDSAAVDGGTSGGDGGTGCAALGGVFCADFDRGSFSEGWTSFALPHGTMTADTAAFVSSPASLLVTLPPKNDYYIGPALEKRMEGPWETIHCKFRFRRDGVGTSGITIANLVVETTAGELAVDARTDTAGGKMHVTTYDATGNNEVSDYQYPNLGFEVGEWHTVGLQLTRQAGSVFIDGNEAAKIAHARSATPLRASVSLGAPGGTPDTATWKLRFDDFHCLTN